MFERLLLSLLVCTVLLEDSGFVQGQGNLLNSVLHRAILTKRRQTRPTATSSTRVFTQ